METDNAWSCLNMNTQVTTVEEENTNLEEAVGVHVIQLATLTIVFWQIN